MVIYPVKSHWNFVCGIITCTFYHNQFDEDHQNTSAREGNAKLAYFTFKSDTEFFPPNFFAEYPWPYSVRIVTNASQTDNNVFADGGNISKLEINSNVATLSCAPFSFLKNLKRFTLKSQINLIEDDAISCIDKLEVLVLRGNKLRSINSKMFRNSNKLEKIDLTDNQIEVIESGSFNLPMLWEINLGKNKLKTIAANTFPSSDGLSIVLSDNLLETFDFELPSALRFLRIENNPIKSTVNVISFVFPLPNLRYLYMANTTSNLEFSHNNPSTHNLSTIDLSRNNLSDPDILDHLAVFPSLYWIHLRENNFETINKIDRASSMFPKLYELLLRCNRFECNWLESHICNVPYFEVANTGDRKDCSVNHNDEHNVKGVECSNK